jgi:hypothetical protein
VQVGRKIVVVDPADIDLAEFQVMFKINGTLCEAPECADDRQPAYGPYPTERSFAFLCESHYNEAHARIGHARHRWNSQLAAHMLTLLNRLSYIYENAESGGELEEQLLIRAQVEADIKRTKAGAQAAERREIRRQINASGESIGLADDEILTARQRQDGRVAAGGKPVGPAPVSRVEKLLPRLIVGSTRPKKE